MPSTTMMAPGMQQFLPNGNILATESNGGRVREVTPDHEVVWEYASSSIVTSAFRVDRDFFEKKFWPGQEGQ